MPRHISKLFEEPERVSFRHLYFSPDRRGASAEADAEKALTEVNGEPQDVKFAGGDPLSEHFPPAAQSAAELSPMGHWPICCATECISARSTIATRVIRASISRSL